MGRFTSLVVMSLILAGSASALQWGVKLGGSTIFKPSPVRWGGNASLEIPLSEEYPTSLAAFFEMYKKDVTIGDSVRHTTTIPTGLSILYKAPLSRYGGMIYFTGGGGIYWASGPDVDDYGDLIVGPNRTQTDGMISVAGGTYVPVTEAISIFGQFRWLKRFASGALNEYGISFGLYFPIGNE